MDEWRELVIDRRSSARVLENDEFRHWMERQRIFVSSCMDEELTPMREALREWIRSWGATPVMWEELAPQDRQAESAYLEGVERSSLFLLVLGTRYGVSSDRSGYSPTHREARRARDRGLPRLVLVKGTVAPESRDGRLNDWLRSIRTEVSTADFTDATDLVGSVEARLREIASEQETPWIKLGRLVFPGRVTRTSRGGETVFHIEGRIRDPEVQNEIGDLGGRWSAGGADRLTWGHQTYPVRIGEVALGSDTLSESSARLTLTSNEDLGSAIYPVSYGEVGPAQQAEIYARRAVFGEAYESRGMMDMLDGATRPEGPALPEVLDRHDANGWMAEGLTRLYVIEALVRKYGGRLRRLEVGPSTSSGIRVRLTYMPSGSDTPVELGGIVPLP